jgi:hypothetical protein
MNVNMKESSVGDNSGLVPLLTVVLLEKVIRKNLHGADLVVRNSDRERCKTRNKDQPLDEYWCTVWVVPQ